MEATESASSPDSGGLPAARILDVARVAGVSRATAARVLGGYRRVTPELQDRVLAAADQLKYQPNMLARALRAGRSKTIGLVVTDISNSFFERSVKAVIDSASGCGYQVLVTNTDESVATERRAVQVLVDNRVDGLIIVPASSTDHEHFTECGRPVVLLDRRISGPPTPTITTDDFGGARSAVEMLLRNGHRRIGLVCGTSASDGWFSRHPPASVLSTTMDRTDGYLSALSAASIDFEPDLVRYTGISAIAAHPGALDLLRSESRPTAILTSDASTALAVITACKELGLVIGRDVSLVTFDDPQWARAITPALSVIARPVGDLGRIAVERLLQLIEGPAAPALRTVLPTELIERDSVAPRAPVALS